MVIPCLYHTYNKVIPYNIYKSSHYTHGLSKETSPVPYNTITSDILQLLLGVIF